MLLNTAIRGIIYAIIYICKLGAIYDRVSDFIQSLPLEGYKYIKFSNSRVISGVRGYKIIK